MPKILSAKGFSLVELMVVVAIVAILAAVAIPAYQNHILRVRQSDVYNDLLDVKAAQEMFYSQFHTYGDMTDGATFTDLLSFNPLANPYYTFAVSQYVTSFTAKFTGKAGTKFENDCITITSFADPATCGTPVGFKFSLMFQ